ncbi:MAG: alpha/beta hydrolase [bacterium]|nr:alpha/beta hydrolase [Gammaproteobacteria bacterium]HIL96024.1 alpha/beta hydrolase [Pseudomonadales bacterium]
METQESHVMANGHRLNTLRIGKIKKEKPTLIFLHGGLDCIAMWREFPARLAAAAGLAAIVYDRWGHGKSDPLVLPRDGDARIVEADQPIIDIIRHFGIGKVILVGHSFGGAIALLASGIHSDLVIGTIAITPQLVAHADGKEGLAKAIAAFKSGKLRDKLMVFHGNQTDTLFEDWSQGSSRPNQKPRDYSTQLNEVECPVLVIYGRQDNYGYMHNLEFTEKNLTCRSESLVIDDARHYPHIEIPEVVIDTCKNFICALDQAH